MHTTKFERPISKQSRRLIRRSSQLFALLLIFGTSATLPSRAADSDLPSWAAPTPKAIAKDVTFKSGDAILSGTLYLPPGNARRPVVIVYHSASDAVREAPLYRHLITMLPPVGVGVFVFDRRGSGRSSGPPPNGSFEALADDGIAARQVLARLPEVDARNIGYWGLSQGGWLAALAAKRDPDCAFAISISAPMVTADEQMLFAVGNVLKIRGYDQSVVDAALDARRGVDEFMRGTTGRDDAQRRLDKAADQPWFDQIYMSKTFSDPSTSGWAREIRNDPLAVMAAVRKPILVIYGAFDPWVPVSPSLDRLGPLAKSHRNITLRVIAGADHAMMTSATALEQVDPTSTARQSPDSTEYFSIMIEWMGQHALLKSSQ